ncbi:MAG: hypothetical protein H6718_01665 [Polyangiaceae bacterium]|nr:hypothetical protein [Myxococcales bacterium]MCB9584071.1 hypothetical protein [Polyangiaceae bacterium]
MSATRVGPGSALGAALLLVLVSLACKSKQACDDHALPGGPSLREWRLRSGDTSDAASARDPTQSDPGRQRRGSRFSARPLDQRGRPISISVWLF